MVDILRAICLSCLGAALVSIGVSGAVDIVDQIGSAEMHLSHVLDASGRVCLGVLGVLCLASALQCIVGHFRADRVFVRKGNEWINVGWNRWGALLLGGLCGIAPFVVLIAVMTIAYGYACVADVELGSKVMISTRWLHGTAMCSVFSAGLSIWLFRGMTLRRASIHQQTKAVAVCYRGWPFPNECCFLGIAKRLVVLKTDELRQCGVVDPVDDLAWLVVEAEMGIAPLFPVFSDLEMRRAAATSHEWNRLLGLSRG